jgi:predicted membrane protein
MKLIFGIIDIIMAFFIWSTLVGAAVLLISTLCSPVKRTGRWKRRAIAFICTVYIIAFIVLKIFYNDIFEVIASGLFWVTAIIATQRTKHEDRMAGKRWWRD